MTDVNKYFTLADSTGYTEKKFRVVLQGYGRPKQKRGKEDPTLDGKLDVQRGGIYQVFDFVVMVRDEELEDGYGSLADLDYFYSLDNPNGSPSDVVTMTDHYGVVRDVVMVGDFDPTPAGVMIKGKDAWFYPKIVMKEVT